IADRNHSLVVAVEHWMLRLQNLRFDDRARRVELRRRPRRIDARRETKFRREKTGGAERDEQAAILHELLELRDALQSHPARDVIRLTVHAEALESLVLLLRNRLPAALDVEHQPFRGAALTRNQDDVVGASKIA